jgi:hypothetical protein
MSDEDDEAARKIIAEGPLFGKAQAVSDRHKDDKFHTPILFPEHIRPHREPLFDAKYAGHRVVSGQEDDNMIGAEPIFEAKYMGNGDASKGGQKTDPGRNTDEKEDLATRLLGYINWVLDQIRPVDLFRPTKTERLPDEAAKIFLQGNECKFHIAFALVSMGGNGEVRQKTAEILSIAKKLFNDADIFKEWKDDINKREHRYRREHYNDNTYAPSNIPDGYWFSNSNKGNPITSYAVSSARNIEVSCNRLPAAICYDPFDATFRIEYEGQVRTISNARQVRSYLLVPIANKFGYEARRDHFEDFIEALKSDETRHFDSVLHYYDPYEAQYDPAFDCVGELVSILNTDNDDYTREGLRSLNIGHVQRG